MLFSQWTVSTGGGEKSWWGEFIIVSAQFQPTFSSCLLMFCFNFLCISALCLLHFHPVAPLLCESAFPTNEFWSSYKAEFG